jgi:uncharacterized membrane protein YdjX (TVP38/TMEM64 family)
MTLPAQQPGQGGTLRRIPFVLLLVAAGLGYYFFGDALSFERLSENRLWLLDVRDAHYALTSLTFIVVYMLVVVTSLPGAIFLTLTGGFLFGIFPGFLYNLVGATVGAVALFIAARMGFGRETAARMQASGGTIGALQAALKDNEWSVLLTMRLIPAIPFFIANLIPAFVGVRLSTFTITTALGILPADLIYTALGASLGGIFARGEVPTLETLFKPEFVWPLVGLGLLAMLPILIKLYRHWRG